MRIRELLCVLAAFAVLIPTSGARAEEDCEGCRDLPYLSRLPSYYLSRLDEAEFDAYSFFNGREVVSIEGRLYKLEYSVKENATKASDLQIRRNYANAVKKAGGKVFVDGTCDGEKCGDLDGIDMVTGTFKHKGKEIWFTVMPKGSGSWYDVVACEKGAMKQDVEISADEMQGALTTNGHIALYIQFDTNKAVIKPESKPLIEEIVKLMGVSGDLKLSVEGHTDSTGDAKKAQKLSEDRAKAVVTALVKAGIDKKRLKSAGWGASKPVAGNDSDEGRAKNRRVELVKVD